MGGSPEIPLLLCKWGRDPIPNGIFKNLRHRGSQADPRKRHCEGANPVVGFVFANAVGWEHNGDRVLPHKLEWVERCDWLLTVLSSGLTNLPLGRSQKLV